jgi:hypothetical protein
MVSTIQASGNICKTHYHETFAIPRRKNDFFCICRIELVQSCYDMAQIENRKSCPVGLVKHLTFEMSEAVQVKGMNEQHTPGFSVE